MLILCFLMTNQMDHIPVMAEEVLQFSREAQGEPQWALDATWGRGGHTRLWLDAFPDLRVVGLDRDLAAHEYAQTHFAKELDASRLQMIHGSFHNLGDLWQSRLQALTLTQGGFDLILADLGVSSPQLDDPLRGFSFYHDGPLDMRMDQGQRTTAATIVNQWSERELNELFQELGEIRSPYRVVRALVHDRRENPFQSTMQLAGLIERVDGWHRRGHHPATKYFLALRLAVNDEISALKPSVLQMIDCLAPGGRLLVITFHSLEDRIIKYAMRESVVKGRMVNKKVVVPSDEECERNPRSRSAKLRVFEREA